MMHLDGIPRFPKPQNAPMPSFAPGTKERILLLEAIQALRSQNPNDVVLPLIIGGNRVLTHHLEPCRIPHDHQRTLGRYAVADEAHVRDAIEAALRAREKWTQLPWYIRLNIFRKAAYLLQTKYFYKFMAAVMEDYSKNPYEAMIDVVELADFWNFNAYYAYEIYQEQPDTLPHNLNILDWRPLEGFVAAISPNNFVSIAGNLPTAPLMMGNVVVCKPSSDTIFSFHVILEMLYDAGLPPEVLSVVHGDGSTVGETILNHPELAGVHFTGGTATFNRIVGRIGRNTEANIYKTYPHRATVGETGGKDFLVVYDDEDPQVAASSIAAGGYGAQGRKCSATSRVYMSDAMWARVAPELADCMSSINVGDVADFQNYLGAIINEREFRKIVRYIEGAKQSLAKHDGEVTEMYGGAYNDSAGWFVHPTVIVTRNPSYVTMKEEIFGPVVTICTLDKTEFSRVLALCDRGSEYGLTGAINTSNVYTLCEALEKLRWAAGNVYDWKTTGAVVGQQPFGGARKSGTDDKAGSKMNLYKWVSPRTISLVNSKPKRFIPDYLNPKTA